MHEGIKGSGKVYYDVKEEKTRNLCNIELDKIINKLFSILRMINQNDTNIDDSKAAIIRNMIDISTKIKNSYQEIKVAQKND